MSSSNQTGQVSSDSTTIEITGTGGGKTMVTVVTGLMFILKMFRMGTLGPLGYALNGVSVVGKFFAYTSVGRIIAAVVIGIFVFSYLRSHITSIERMKWEKVVAEKQNQMDEKVDQVNSETRVRQEVAQERTGLWDKIFAVAADGIWKVQPPDEIKAETIDLINATRGSLNDKQTTTVPTH